MTDKILNTLFPFTGSLIFTIISIDSQKIFEIIIFSIIGSFVGTLIKELTALLKNKFNNKK